MSVTTEVQGTWLKVKGLVKEKWGKITDNEIEMIDGKKDKLVGALIAKYGMTKEKAEQEVGKFWH